MEQLTLPDLIGYWEFHNRTEGKSKKTIGWYNESLGSLARCQAALAAYLALRGTEPGPLFVATTGHGQLVPGVALQPNGLKQLLRRLGRRAGVPKVHAHRFRHTFATWAIEHDARELDVQYLLGHASPDMVRRYSSAFRSEQAATRHHRFSPADQMLDGVC